MMSSVVQSKVEERKEAKKLVVDRTKTCPLLLRVFCTTGQHNSANEYRRGETPSSELQIYTWLDATLLEIAALVTEVHPDYRRKGTLFDFEMVDTSNPRIPRTKRIGAIVIGQKGFEDEKSLAEAEFTIGDFLDIMVNPPGTGAFRGPPNRRGANMRQQY